MNCDARRPGFENRSSIGRWSISCAREAGHDGPHESALGDQWGAAPATIKPNVGDVYLTPDEIEALRALVADLVAATDNHTFWFNRVRDTAIELQNTLSEWLEPSN